MFTLGAFLQKHWDTEDKSAKPNNHAGLQPVGNWGQSEDRLRTKWEHFYMMKLIQSLICYLFPLTNPAPALLPALLAGFAHYWNWARMGLSLEPPHRAAPVDNFSAVASVSGACILSNASAVRNPASALKNSLKAEILSTMRIFHYGRYVNYEYENVNYVFNKEQTC